MKRTTLTLAALVVATIATGAAAPVLAQDVTAGRTAGEHPRELQLRGPAGKGHLTVRRDHGQRDSMRMRQGMRQGGGVLTLVCSANGADRLEHRLLNLRQRTDPTAEQMPLFEDFQAAALIAQTEFADACASVRPAADQARDVDIVDRMRAGLEIQQAHLDAMTAVLPSFEAFFQSLNDEQKAQLTARRGDGKRGDRFDRRMRAPAPSVPDQG